MIGKQIGARYELLEHIGGGGMAIVYKAHDVLLNRKVAVKILREQYVNDEDFIRRFRREAQSAASLSHPNVVSIYDVGQEDDVHYIVMEYVAGSNLNEEIRRRAPFQVDEALRIAVQICDALDHAHQNQIIHRDIKPHNILIGRNGRVKVTDFGIARAASSADITQTGSVIGSVHYLSPEHAKGIKQGEKSDIYSLGIVLYQMLTNQLPFSGDSPISVALKHLQEQVESPRLYNPHIPPDVEAIILKTLQKNPEERYNSAKELQQDLEAIMDGDRIDTIVRFVDASHSPDELDEHPTKVMPAIRDEDDEQTRLMPAIGSSAKVTSAESSLPDEEENVKSEEDKPGLSPLKKLFIKAAIWLVLIFAFGAGTWYGVQSLKAIFVVPEVEVPNVVGYPIDEAVQMLAAVDLIPDITYEFSDEVEKDHVIRQDSDPTLKANSSVSLYVSNGILLEKMPEAVGLELEPFIEELEQLGVDRDRIKITEDYSEDYEAGVILEQLPEAGEEFDPRMQIISLVVSQGPELIEMPDIINKSQSVANSMLLSAGLEPIVQEEHSFTVPSGIVTRLLTAQPGEMVKIGSEIIYFVSAGFPDDALEPTYMLEVSPKEEGEPSTVRIEVYDARGFHVWGSVTIDKTEVIPVRVIVSENHNANIEYYVNDKHKDRITVTYKNAVDQDAPKPHPLNADDYLNPASAAADLSAAANESSSANAEAAAGSASDEAEEPRRENHD